MALLLHVILIKAHLMILIPGFVIVIVIVYLTLTVHRL